VRRALGEDGAESANDAYLKDGANAYYRCGGAFKMSCPKFFPRLKKISLAAKF